MKKKALKKDFRREVRKSLNRFLSILFIVAMGVAMFAGIQASAPDMRVTGDAFFDEGNLMDVRVVGTLGITEGDLEALRGLEGVQTVEAGYMTDVLCGTGEQQTVLHVETLLETVNQVTLREGRLPERSGECFLDASYMQTQGYQLGDKIKVLLPEAEKGGAEEAETETEETSSLLAASVFEIVGSGDSSVYVSHSRGSSSLGTGEVSGFMYLLPRDFDSEVYTVAYMTVEGALDAVSYTEEYQRLVDEVLERTEGIQNVRCEIRYREVVDEAQSALDEHKAELAEGESELADARQELEDGKKSAESELTKAKEDLESGESELADGKQQLQEKENELSAARQQLASGETQISRKESELAAAKEKLTAGEAQLRSAKQELNQRQEEYDRNAVSAESELTAGQQQVDQARQELDAGKAQLESERVRLESEAARSSEAAAALDASQAEYEAGAASLAEGEKNYAAGKAQLDAAWAEYYANETAYYQQKESYDTGSAQLGTLEGQKSAALQAAEQQQSQAETLRTANGTLEAEAAGLESEITALNANISGWQSEAETLQGSISSWQSELEQLEDTEETAERRGELAVLISGAEGQIGTISGSISSAQNEISGKQTALAEKRGQITANQESISAAEAEAEKQSQTAAALEPEIAQLSETLAASAPALEASRLQLEAAKTNLDARTAALEASRAELDAQTTSLNASKEQLDAGRAELAAGETQILAGQAQLEQSRLQLENGQKEIEENQQKIDAGRAELESGKTQLEEAWKEIAGSQEQLNASRSQINSGESQLAAGKQTLAASRAELNSGEQQIESAKAEIEENEQKIKDGWIEYEKGLKEAESEILDGESQIREAETELAEARAKLEDAQKKIEEIEAPEWYVHDREIHTDYSSMGENAERMVNLGKVFPTLFFLVAALISLTTMTRMVEEQRTQIGTLKALGYSKFSIASKYMKYALYATLGGSAAGILIGQKVLPFVIVWAYGMMYPSLRSPILPYHWEYGLMATGAALICTLGATFASCYKELKASPAVLMRPPAPKEGKRVILEGIPFLWKHLSFSWKSTVRNLFRYKKRFFMTVIGIGGCMGLLLVGFGLNDSIVGIGDLQYQQLQLYDMMAILEGKDPKKEEEVISCMEEQAGAENIRRICMQKITVTDGKKEYNPYLYIPEDTDTLEQFLVLRDRVSGEQYELDDEGAFVTEKLASMLDLKIGDELMIQDEKVGRITVPVTRIVENYLYHYVYLTPAVYQRIYHMPAEYNAVIVKSGTGETERLGETILDKEGVLNVVYTASTAKQLEDMLGSLNVVVIVLIICAGMLAFVVLYNLNNININERRRELATLKVLGFYDSEVAMYVYRENILLTLIGAAVGIGMGMILHQFVITTVEVDTCMFGRTIHPLSFLYGTLFTIGFSLIVNGVMFFKLKKIDMVESLKSVE